MQEAHQRWALNGLAVSYAASGQPRKGAGLGERHNAICRRQKDMINLAIGLTNLAAMAQTGLGELQTAEANLRRAIELCGETEHELQEAAGRAELVLVLVHRGEFGASSEQLNGALVVFGERAAFQGECVVWTYRALQALLMGDARRALEAARKARQLADETARVLYPHERDIVRVEWFLGWARVALADEDEGRRGEHLRQAEGHLTEALTRCRRINMVGFEPDILLAWARWHRLKGNSEEALGQAREALSIADRCEYRLAQADLHNFLARIAMDEDDRERVAEEAKVAYERAWCDGPPYCYKPALDEAEAMLKELGVEPPELPPFEGPMPEEWEAEGEE